MRRLRMFALAALVPLAFLGYRQMTAAPAAPGPLSGGGVLIGGVFVALLGLGVATYLRRRVGGED